MALATRAVGPDGLVHHSDRGVQYACGDYIGRLERAGIQPSMSRPGCPWDNAMAESFMRTLKREEVDGRAYRGEAEVRASIGPFIEVVYNGQRLHSALAYMTPEEYEASQHRMLAERSVSNFPVSPMGCSPEQPSTTGEVPGICACNHARLISPSRMFLRKLCCASEGSFERHDRGRTGRDPVSR